MKINAKTSLLLILSAVLIAGCTAPTADKSVNQSSVAGVSDNQVKQEQSLKDALNMGKSLKCTYATQAGTMTAYVKGKKVRLETGTGGMINDSESLYIWNDTDKTGMKYLLSALPSPGSTGGKINAGELKDVDIWAQDVQDKYKAVCNPDTVNDDQFIPPADVTFQDFSKIFEKMNGLKEILPSINPENESSSTAVPDY